METGYFPQAVKIDLNYMKLPTSFKTKQGQRFHQSTIPGIFQPKEETIVPKTVYDCLAQFAPSQHVQETISLATLPKVKDSKLSQMLSELELEISKTNEVEELEYSPPEKPAKPKEFAKTIFKASQFNPELYGYNERKETKLNKKPHLLEKYRKEVQEIRKNESEYFAKMKQKINQHIVLGKWEGKFLPKEKNALEQIFISEIPLNKPRTKCEFRTKIPKSSKHANNKTYIEELRSSPSALKFAEELNSVKPSTKPRIFVRNDENFKVNKRTILHKNAAFLSPLENSTNKFMPKRFQRIPRFAVCCKTPQVPTVGQDQMERPEIFPEPQTETEPSQVFSIQAYKKTVVSEAVGPTRKQSVHKQCIPALNFNDIFIQPATRSRMRKALEEPSNSPKGVTRRPVFQKKCNNNIIKTKKDRNESLVIDCKGSIDKSVQLNTTIDYNTGNSLLLPSNGNPTPSFTKPQTPRETFRRTDAEVNATHEVVNNKEFDELQEYERKLQQIDRLLGIGKNRGERVASYVEQKLVKRPKTNVNSHAFCESNAIFDLRQAISKGKGVLPDLCYKLQ